MKKKPGLAIILESIKKKGGDRSPAKDDMMEEEGEYGEDEEKSMLASDILEAVESGDPDLLAQSLKDFVQACMDNPEEY